MSQDRPSEFKKHETEQSKPKVRQPDAPRGDRETELDEEGSVPRMLDLVHDIRTPLVAVRGYAKMLLEERDGPLNGTQREYLAIVVENANQVIRLLNDLDRVVRRETP